MRKVVVFGNSGSGKSTLASRIADAEGIAHLDLDTLAWLPTDPPQRKPVSDSRRAMEQFMSCHRAWVIEGCYSDLLEIALPRSNEIIYLNLPIEACVENARSRPWEPHKYESSRAQDAALDMLIDWIRQYDDRQDTFSRAAHMRLYNGYRGKKSMRRVNQ